MANRLLRWLTSSLRHGLRAIERRFNTPLVLRYAVRFRVPIDLRLALAAVLLIIAAAVAFPRPPGGVWNLASGPQSIVCAALDGCSDGAAPVVAALADWEERDLVIRRYFSFIYNSLGTARPCRGSSKSAQAQPASPIPEASLRAEDEPFNQIRASIANIPASTRAAPALHGLLDTDHTAVLLALAALDGFAQREVSAELDKLEALGANRRTQEHRLSGKALCYRRRLRALSFIENAWHMGRLTCRSEWHVDSCDDALVSQTSPFTSEVAA